MSSKGTGQPNFQFLASVEPMFAELGARAERYALDDPNTSMIKVRQLGELLAKFIAVKKCSTILPSDAKEAKEVWSGVVAGEKWAEAAESF